MSDTTPNIPSKVLERIKKLMSVASAGEGRVNENEAANAAAMAQQLAADYNLELAQLELDGGSDAPAGGKREKTQVDHSAMYKYQRDLMGAIAGTHFCRHFIVEVHAMSFGKMRCVKRHVLLGRDVNVKAAIMVYDYLIETMDRLLPYTGMEKRGRSALLWLEGCSDRLGVRLRDKRHAMEEEGKRRRAEEETRSKHPGAAPSGNALVLSDVYSSEDDFNNDYIRGVPPGTTARERKEREARYEAQQAERQAKRQRLIDAGYSDEMARLMANGYPEREAEEILARERARLNAIAAPPKPETDAQRRKRQEREARQERDSERRYWKANARARTAEYQAGSRTGANIGLDDQIAGGKTGALK